MVRQKPNETAAHRAEKMLAPTDEPTRKWLLLRLRRILEIAMERVTNPKTAAPDRIKWSRVLISAGQACNSILRDVEIEELREQIQQLKEIVEERFADEQNGNQEGNRTTQEEA